MALTSPVCAGIARPLIDVRSRVYRNVKPMNEESETRPVIESWDTYWAGAQSSAAFSGGGTTDPLVLSFWDDFFRDVRGSRDAPRIIDIASGNGAIIESASRAYEENLPEFTCLDISDSAIRMLEERFPGVRGVVADAANSPFDPGSFDVVVSQYGVEYAGLDAIHAIARLVAPGGDLVLLVHHSEGLIHEQCDASLNAIRDMKDADFIPRCIAMFDTAYAVLQGGDKAAYQEAGRKFAPAIKAMEDIMQRYGRDVAADTIMRVYRDVRTIHQRMQHYDGASVVGWLEKMADAIDAYEGRMASMLDVAIDAAQFEGVVARLNNSGFEINRSDALAHSTEAPPLAWALMATRT